MLQTTQTNPAVLARRPDTAGPPPVDDASLAVYLGELFEAGRAPATAADRGRGQAAPLSADGLAAILATAARPRTDGRGVESHTTAQRRGRLDAVIASLLFMGGLRRSEVSALEWRDVVGRQRRRRPCAISKTARRKRSAPFAPPPPPHPRIG